ncbi:MAG: hypothetical protein ACM3TU_00565 [Bacillota bacterium]
MSWSPDQEVQRGLYELLPSNGSYVRAGNWKKRYKIEKKVPRIPFHFTVGDRKYAGNITDKRLVARITEYMRDYYGKKYTNCSTFAHFLTTGTFIECDSERNLLVLTQGMREYRDETIRVGDMLCVIYAHDRYWRSRVMPHRNSYLKAKKKRHGTNEFSHALAQKNKVLTAEKILEICKLPTIADYHFMVCVAKHPEGPVWLSQGGKYPPDGRPSPLLFTIGNDDGCPGAVPLLALLKRRR